MVEKSQADYRDEYRALLVESAHESQRSYDTTLVTLSSGALGISFVFIEQIIGTDPMVAAWLLATAWVSWCISLTLVLYSFYSSHLALQKAVREVDKGTPLTKSPGGMFNRMTTVFNALSGIAFIVGVAAMVWFVLLNL